MYAALELWPFEMYAERATTMTVTMTVYARTAAEAKEKAQRTIRHGHELSNWNVEALEPAPAD